MSVYIKDEVDNGAAALYAQEAMYGFRDDGDARRQLGWLLVMSSLPGRWSAEFVARTGEKYLRDEVETAIKQALLRKCQQTDGNTVLDLSLIAGGTELSAWANGLCSSRHFGPSVLRNVRAARRKDGVETTIRPVADDEIDGGSTTDGQIDHYTPVHGVTANTEETSSTLELESVEDFASYLKTKCKTNARVHVGARHLASGAGLTIPSAAISSSTRKDIAKELSLGTASAGRAIRQARDRGRIPGSEIPETARVLADHFSEEELTIMSESPNSVTYSMLMAMATPRPAVGTAVRKRLRSSVKDISDTRGWRTLAGRLVYSYLVAIADIPNEDSPTFSTAEVRSVRAARRDEKLLRDVSGEVAAFPGSPMGCTPHEVESKLSGMLAISEAEIAEEFVANHSSIDAA